MGPASPSSKGCDLVMIMADVSWVPNTLCAFSGHPLGANDVRAYFPALQVRKLRLGPGKRLIQVPSLPGEDRKAVFAQGSPALWVQHCNLKRGQ